MTHAYGCGVAINAPGAAAPIRTLQNLARNPIGGEVMVVGLGCEKLVPERLRTQVDQRCRTGSRHSHGRARRVWFSSGPSRFLADDREASPGLDPSNDV
jgi:altronate dehydratase